MEDGLIFFLNKDRTFEEAQKTSVEVGRITEKKKEDVRVKGWKEGVAPSSMGYRQKGGLFFWRKKRASKKEKTKLTIGLKSIELSEVILYSSL